MWAPAAVVAPDVHDTVTETLFAPFPTDEMPLSLDVHQLRQLLQQRPACLVPVLPYNFLKIQRLWPANKVLPRAPLFKQANEHAGDVGMFLYTALACRWPKHALTIEDLVTTWENIGYGLPAQLEEWRNLPVMMARSFCCTFCFTSYLCCIRYHPQASHSA